jgi:glycine cleavage system regulatory protein
MQINIRLLTPDKKAIAKRLAAAVESAGGKIQDLHVIRRMRGMNETSIRISLADDRLKKAALDSLGQIPGVAVLSSTDLPTAS